MLNINKKRKIFPYRCRICDAPAQHSYFGAIACDPCKTFFRRHSNDSQTNLKCNFGGDCEININTRHICSACRLAKCLRCGMSTMLFRPSRISKHTTNALVPLQQQSVTLPTLNLLQADQSRLTTDQWTLLSNLLYSYSEAETLSFCQSLIDMGTTIESTNVLRDIYINKILSSLYESVGKYIASNADLRQLSFDDRSVVHRSVADNVCYASSVFIFQYGNLHNSDAFLNVALKKYGKPSVDLHLFARKFVDPDIVLAKLSISLFAFSQSSHCYLDDFTNLPNTVSLFHIQSKYAEIAWKYLLYRYGYRDSVKRFLNLTVWLTSMSSLAIYAQTVTVHVNDIYSIIEQTEFNLIIDDIESLESENQKKSLFSDT